MEIDMININHLHCNLKIFTLFHLAYMVTNGLNNCTANNSADLTL